MKENNSNEYSSLNDQDQERNSCKVFLSEDKSKPDPALNKFLSRGHLGRTSLKEAVLLRKFEKERKSKNHWNVSRFSSSDGAIELRDNTENIRKKLLQNRKQLDDLLRRFPNVSKSHKQDLTKSLKANDLSRHSGSSISGALKRLNGSRYPHSDESSSDEDLRDPMEESHPELSDEDRLDSDRVATSHSPVKNDVAGNDVVPSTFSPSSGASKTRLINVTRTSLRGSSLDNQSPKTAPANHLYEAAKPRPPPRRTHHHIKRIMLQKVADQSKNGHDYANTTSPLNGEGFAKPQIVTLPYVSRGTAKSHLHRNSRSDSVTNDKLEPASKEVQKRDSSADNFSLHNIRRRESPKASSLIKNNKDASPSRGTMSSSGYSSLGGSSSLSPSTSNASSTMSSNAISPSSDRFENDLIDARCRSVTQTSADSETTHLKTLPEAQNDDNSVSNSNIDEDEVFPVNAWVESAEYKEMEQKYAEDLTDAKRIQRQRPSKTSQNKKSTRSDKTSRAREALPQRPKSAYVTPSANSISMVEQSQEVMSRARTGSAHALLRFPAAISRSKKSTASRNSRAFALQARSQSDISSLDYADAESLVTFPRDFNKSLEEEDQVKRVASLSPTSFASDKLPTSKREMSASLANLHRASSSEKQFNTVSGATGRHLSERHDFFQDETLANTKDNNDLYRSSPSVYKSSSWSLNPSAKSQRTSDRKPSFRNRLKGAFSFQNIRKAISMERLDEDERVKSVSHCYLNEYGEDIAQVSKTKNSTNSLPRGGKLYKPSSVTSIMNTVRMRKRKSRERREAKARNTIAIDPRHHSEFENSRYKEENQRNSYNDDVGTPAHFRPIGRVLQMDNRQGTLLVEMLKPPSGPFGFYVARRKETGSVYISSMRDSYPDKMYVGLMQLGDEITEINGIQVSSLTLEQIYDLILENSSLLLRIKPAQVHSV